MIDEIKADAPAMDWKENFEALEKRVAGLEEAALQSMRVLGLVIEATQIHQAIIEAANPLPATPPEETAPVKAEA